MKKKLFFTLRWLTAIAVFLFLIVIGYQCLALYQQDTKPLFSAEKVTQSLLQAAPVLMGCLSLIVLSLLLHAVHPMQNPAVPLSVENRLRLMKKRLSTLPPEAQQEEKKRRFIGLLATGGVLLCIVWCLVFLLNQENFRSWDLDMVLGNMLLHTTPALIGAGLILYIAFVCCDRSREKECILLRSVSRDKPDACTEKKPVSTAVVRIAILSVALLFIVLGAMNGGLQDMLSKAIKICTECIGLG